MVLYIYLMMSQGQARSSSKIICTITTTSLECDRRTVWLAGRALLLDNITLTNSAEWAWSSQFKNSLIYFISLTTKSPKLDLSGSSELVWRRLAKVRKEKSVRHGTTSEMVRGDTRSTCHWKKFKPPMESLQLNSTKTFHHIKKSNSVRVIMLSIQVQIFNFRCVICIVGAY